MKTLIATALGLSFVAASIAQAAPTFHCVGIRKGQAIELDFYRGYGYDATYAYFENGNLASSGYAHGSSYSECGSRTTPCMVITITQYEAKDANLAFTMVSPGGAHKGHGNLSFYGGEANDPAERVPVDCDLN